MVQPANRFYEFGTFRIDAAKRLLLRGHEAVPITPKCFDILLVLVTSSGEVVSKDELMKRVWPDSFVEDNNLTYNISVLRKALGERAGEHLYIITAPGQGYRFAVEVKEIILKPEETLSGDLATPPFARRSVKSKVAIAAALVIAFSGILLYWIATKPQPESGPTAVVKSIAVLPFELLGAEKDSEAEYLSDGISESLINNLSQLPSLKVIARSSSFKYKGKAADPQEVARALGVEAIVTGRVSQRSEQLKISVELMDARDKTQIWGEQYNRKSTDLLNMQAEISREITRKLRLKLTNAEQQQLTGQETANPQAYDLLLKGRFYRNKGGTGNTKKAVDYLNQAIAIDPKYALAYAELSISYQCSCIVSDLNPREYLPKSVVAAQKALELDERIAEAHLALAMTKENDWDWQAAEQEYKRAIKLNANLALAHNLFVTFLIINGRHEEALAEVNRTKELDPLSPQTSQAVGILFYLARQYDLGIDAMKKMIELDPNYPYLHQILGYNYAGKEMFLEAIAAYREANRLGDVSPSTQIYLGAAYAKAGETAKARAILKRLQMTGDYVSPGELAVLYTALSEHEQALASLERAYASHDLQMKYLGVDPALDPLRSDPRFIDLVRRIGFTQ